MKDKIYAVLGEVNKKIIQYEGDNMLEDEIIESMEIMDIVVRLEEALDIEIGPEYIIPEYFMHRDTIVKMVEDIQKETGDGEKDQ